MPDVCITSGRDIAAAWAAIRSDKRGSRLADQALQKTIQDPTQYRRRFTLSGRLKSFDYALRGVLLMLKSQHNAWLHAVATLLVVLVGRLVCHLSSGEWCALVLAIMAVWTAEALNTALEFLADVASPEFHPLVEKAKDVAAGAVLISATGSVVIALLVFGPYIQALFKAAP